MNFHGGNGSFVSDRDLIESALNGEETGFEQLVQRYQERLIGAMQNNVGSLEMAEDIVQDAFVRAFLHLSKFRRECNFYTWIYRIAINSRRDYYRMSKRTVSLDSINGELQSAGSHLHSSPSAAAERQEDCNQVREALARLNTRDRTILVMREIELLHYETISRKLQLPMGTVRSRLCRARAKLRLELASGRKANLRLQTQ